MRKKPNSVILEEMKNPPLRQIEVCIIINGSIEKVLIQAKVITIEDLQLNAWIDRCLVASFQTWVYFRHIH